MTEFSAPRAAFAPQNVVFLHAGWRCASTYVWSRFRALQRTTCFYEPFAENLSALSSRRIDRDSKRDWRSRHPALGAPYRTEYRPLLRPVLRGVPGYRPSFALAGYFPRGEACREECYRYQTNEPRADPRTTRTTKHRRSPCVVVHDRIGGTAPRWVVAVSR